MKYLFKLQFLLYDVISNAKAIPHNIDALVRARITCRRFLSDAHFLTYCQEAADGSAFLIKSSYCTEGKVSSQSKPL